MVGPVVVIEIVEERGPPEPALARAMIEACVQAVGRDGACDLAAANRTAPLRAHVRWADAEHVEIRLEPAGLSRALAFRDVDEPSERWRSVGLVVGTIASLTELPAPPAPPPPASEPPPARDERPRAAPVKRPPPEPAVTPSVEVIGLVGRGLDDAWIAGGGIGARVDLRFGGFARLSLAHSEQLGDASGVDARFSALRGAVGYRIALGETVSLEPALGAALERIEIDAELGGESDVAVRWLVSPSAALGAQARLGSWTAGAGLEVLQRTRRARISVGGEPRAAWPGTAVGGFCTLGRSF